VAFADDAPAIASAVQLAKAAAEAGLEVQLVVGDHPSLALLRTACTVPSAPGSPVGSHLYEPGHANPEFLDVRLTLWVIGIDSERPELPTTAATSILVVSSGFATAETLARAALAASDARSPFEGIVLVNPEANDSTTGSVAQAERPRQLTRRVPQSLGGYAVGRSK